MKVPWTPIFGVVVLVGLIIAAILFTRKTKCELPEDNTCPMGLDNYRQVPYCDDETGNVVCRNATEICTDNCGDNMVRDECLWNQSPPVWSCKAAPPPPPIAGQNCTVEGNVLQFPMIVNNELTDNTTPVDGYATYTIEPIGEEFGCKLASCNTDNFTNDKVSSGWCLPKDNGDTCDPMKIREHDPSDNHVRPDGFGVFNKSYTGDFGKTLQCNFTQCKNNYVLDGNKCVKKTTPCINPSDPNATGFDNNCKIVKCKTNYTPNPDGTACVRTSCPSDATFTYNLVNGECVKSGCVEPYLKLQGNKCEVDCTDRATIGHFIYGNPNWRDIDACSINNVQVQATLDGKKCILKTIPNPTDEQKIFGYCGNSTNCPQYAMSADKQRCEIAFTSERSKWVSPYGSPYGDSIGCLECPPLYCKPGTTTETASIPGNCINLIPGCDYSADTAGNNAIDACKKEHTNTINVADYEIPGFQGVTWGKYKETGMSVYNGKELITLGGYPIVDRPTTKVRFYKSKNSKGKDPTVYIYDQIGKEVKHFVVHSDSKDDINDTVVMDNKGSFKIVHDKYWEHAITVQMPDLIKQARNCKSTIPGVDINVHTWLSEKHNYPGWKLDNCAK